MSSPKNLPFVINHTACILLNLESLTAVISVGSDTDFSAALVVGRCNWYCPFLLHTYSSTTCKYCQKPSTTGPTTPTSASDCFAAVVVSFAAPIARVSDILVLRPHNLGDHVFGNAVDALFVVLVDHAVGHALEPIVLSTALASSATRCDQRTSNVVLRMAGADRLG